MRMKGVKFNSSWCFAVVNGKLAEIHFQKLSIKNRGTNKQDLVKQI